MKILIFDTESTGLLPKCTLSKENLNQFPRIVQISWIVYDLTKNITHSVSNHILKTNIKITNSHIHGITNNICLEKGICPIDALNFFIDDCNISDILVAHNINFDLTVVKAELTRYGLSSKIPFLEEMSKHCTMESSKFLVNAKFPNGGIKWPKLQDLFFKLFNYNFESAHNSLYDVVATLKSYLKYEHSIDLKQDLI
jgi:DNA polymerase III epsilon subunit-like protein